jgi:uncharacterized membrane protein
LGRPLTWKILFISLALTSFAFCVPFLSVDHFCWVEMNAQIQAVIFLLAAAFFLYAALHWSVSNALRLLGITFLFSYGSEVLGIHWGWFFGSQYTYAPSLYPVLPGGVPVIIILMWFMLAFLSLQFLNPISIRTKGALSTGRILLKGSLCALYMTAVDLIIDPLGTYSGLWFWDEPGDYFGTPLGNFRGWFLVGLVICCLYLRTEKPRHRDYFLRDPHFEGIFFAFVFVLTLVCCIACLIHLGSGWPIFLSMAVIVPAWIYWIVFNAKTGS